LDDESIWDSEPASRTPLPALRFDTRLNREHFTFAAWQSILGEFYDVALPDTLDSQPFAAALTTWKLDSVLLSEGVHSAQRFHRSATRARHDGFDPYTLRLHRQGHWGADTGEHAVNSPTDQLCMLDFARPLVTEAGRNDAITITLPRDFLDAALPPRDMHGLVLQGGLRRLAARLRRRTDRPAPHDAGR
jgi:hypothetical protein